MVAGLFGMFFLGALYLERVLGFSPIEIGLAFLPVTAIIGTLSLGFSARLNLRFGPRATLVPGLVAVARRAGATSPASGSTAAMSATCCRRWCCSGVGAGLSFPALMSLAMTGVRPQEAGLASGPGQHHDPGRRGARPGRAGDALDRSHRQPGRRRRGHQRRGADRRLPAGLPGRRRPRGRRGRGGPRRHPLRPDPPRPSKRPRPSRSSPPRRPDGTAQRSPDRVIPSFANCRQVR